ncbi:MAG: alpha/beta fold hydrolase, partial [Gammaproteobacteria bacterium]
MSTSTSGTAYALSGPETAPVVALIHGIGVNQHLWRDYRSALSERYRVLSYDLYGHGESMRPPAMLSLTLFAAQLRELLDELNIERCAAVGYSLGGMINRRFAMDYP